ncbi:DNA polymerase III subunit chi [Sphingomonas xanthus]|uniref:DNA polymerase III subunit chi n=1 Tax=Sphingomonas xanthus TaxID=2594473 RepID=A0A516ITQ2_9SPHN|nr:DNA polymerase III subunit chi [Sphingomonas xanthus]QDP20260.1 DNA polymerase III subunit chi [Sphingomonas xanthus]
MRVDFYQLGGLQPDSVIASIAGRLIEEGQRLLVVASDEVLLGKLDRLLWDQGPVSFLPHGMAGGPDDAAQPILLSTGADSPNQARNLLIADGEWREAALSYERAFYLFDESTLKGARMAWKLLAGREGVERNYWSSEDGRWTKKG